jgi:hypothetical protein
MSCSLCNSPGVYKTTCPLNNKTNETKSNYDQHPLSVRKYVVNAHGRQSFHDVPRLPSDTTLYMFAGYDSILTYDILEDEILPFLCSGKADIYAKQIVSKGNRYWDVEIFRDTTGLFIAGIYDCTRKKNILEINESFSLSFILKQIKIYDKAVYSEKRHIKIYTFICRSPYLPQTNVKKDHFMADQSDEFKYEAGQSDEFENEDAHAAAYPHPSSYEAAPEPAAAGAHAGAAAGAGSGSGAGAGSSADKKTPVFLGGFDYDKLYDEFGEAVFDSDIDSDDEQM